MKKRFTEEELEFDGSDDDELLHTVSQVLVLFSAWSFIASDSNSSMSQKVICELHGILRIKTML